MSAVLYATLRHFSRFVRRQCLREVVLHADRGARDGGFLLAPTHLSHVEPLILTAMIERPISWMARIEFRRIPIVAGMLDRCGVFFINRKGVPVRAIRTAIRESSRGSVVGMFPEGGCRKGRELAIRGGRIKQGICTIALRAQVPVVPVVVLGTDKLNAIEPWLPGRYGKLWVAFGQTIHPPHNPPRRHRRAARRELASRIEREYVRSYCELLQHAGISDQITP